MNERACEETRSVPMPIAQSAYDGSPTQVGMQIAMTPELLDGVFETLSILEARLVGVMRYPQDEDVPDGLDMKAVIQEMVPVADQLNHYNDRIRLIRRRVQDLIDRLEL